MPEVLVVGDHWLLTEWIVGTRPVDALQGSVLPATAWLESLARAHESGVAVGDRWGGNELLTADGTAVLIDFDLEFQTDGPLEELMALDLAVALRAVLRWTSDEHRSVRQIVE